MARRLGYMAEAYQLLHKDQNGRRYHSLGRGTYVILNDEGEQER